MFDIDVTKLEKSVIAPLGIVSKDIWLFNVKNDRYEALNRAISRYLQANLPIKEEWVQERNELHRELQK